MRTASQIISEIKEQYNLNGSQLANQIGIAPSRINAITRGTSSCISNEIVMALIKGIPDINPDFIVHGELPVRLTIKHDTPLSSYERICKIIEHYGLSESSFCTAIGWKRSILSGMKSGKQYRNITPDRINQIISVFPDVSVSWLRTGVGDILASTENIDVRDMEAVTDVIKQKTHENDALRRRNDELERKVSELYEMIGKLAKMQGVTNPMLHPISTSSSKMAAEPLEGEE